MTWQMKNWYYFTWLSGDFNVEQHVHYLDVCSWLKGQYPVKAVGLGGRQVRTGPEYGHIYDHFCVEYLYPNDVRIVHECRQQDGTSDRVTEYYVGTKGMMEPSAGPIKRASGR